MVGGEGGILGRDVSHLSQPAVGQHRRFHCDLSSGSSNITAGNLLISSSLILGTIIFKNKYIMNTEKFRTVIKDIL